ncbi:f-box only protein [Anaeramoeba flamelloides]|uniref:F-box only protein n=1 Tax=Anaeramoeba flamelloides TaxID=1746091 RepID=A0AAV8ACE6_9EUKA|nr:f-box only protein [Anaeramoeba flamelloides]
MNYKTLLEQLESLDKKLEDKPTLNNLTHDQSIDDLLLELEIKKKEENEENYSSQSNDYIITTTLTNISTSPKSFLSKTSTFPDLLSFETPLSSTKVTQSKSHQINLEFENTDFDSLLNQLEDPENFNSTNKTTNPNRNTNTNTNTNTHKNTNTNTNLKTFQNSNNSPKKENNNNSSTHFNDDLDSLLQQYGFSSNIKKSHSINNQLNNVILENSTNSANFSSSTLNSQFSQLDSLPYISKQVQNKNELEKENQKNSEEIDFEKEPDFDNLPNFNKPFHEANQYLTCGKRLWKKGKISQVKPETDLHEIIRRSNDGDVIQIYPGSYHLSVKLSKSLYIVGIGDSPNDIILNTISSGSPIFEINTSYLILENLKLVSQKNDPTILLTKGELLVEHCQISSQGDCGILAYGDESKAIIYASQFMNCNKVALLFCSGSTGVVSHCIFQPSNQSDLEISGKGTSPKILNSEFNNGIICHDCSAPLIKNCKITSLNSSGIIVMTKSNPKIYQNLFINCKNYLLLITNSGKGEIMNNKLVDNFQFDNLALILIDGFQTIPYLEKNLLTFEKNINNENQSSSNKNNNKNDDDDDDENTVNGLNISKNTKRRKQDLENEIEKEKCNGIWIKNNSKPIIKLNQIYKMNGHGIIISNQSTCKIESNKIKNCNQSGIVISRSNSLVLNNEIIGSLLNGIELIDNCTSTLKENKVMRNTHSGLLITNGSKAKIIANEICNNGISNVYISDESTKPKLKSNQIHNSLGNGIIFTNKSSGILTENKIYQNTEHGCYIDKGSHPRIISNDFEHCKSISLLVRDQSTCPVIMKNNFKKNNDISLLITDHANGTFVENTFIKGNGSAICVTNGAHGQIRKNIIKEHPQTSIIIENASPRIEQNQIFDSNTVAIYVNNDAENCQTKIIENKIHHSVNAAIEINSGNDTIERNFISFSHGFGILILGKKTNPRIIMNEISQNKRAAILINKFSDPYIIGNHIFRGKGPGISSVKGAKGKVEQNRILNNEGGAFNIFPGSKTKIGKNLLY